jgi:hypothetical protein
LTTAPPAGVASVRYTVFHVSVAPPVAEVAPRVSVRSATEDAELTTVTVTTALCVPAPTPVPLIVKL